MDENDKRIVENVWDQYKRLPPLERLRIVDDYVACTKNPAAPNPTSIDFDNFGTSRPSSPGSPFNRAEVTACYLEAKDMTRLRRDMQWQAIKERLGLAKEQLKKAFMGVFRLVKLQLQVWRGE